jgi:hypothetical protein
LNQEVRKPEKSLGLELFVDSESFTLYRCRVMVHTHKGTCFCGAVAIEVTGAPLDMGYCHCNNCRTYSGAPLRAFTLWKPDNVTITNGAELLGRFKQSEMSDRRFCTKCGSHVMIDHPTLGLVDIHASVLPTLIFKPTVHLNYEEAVLSVKDGLPKLRDFPAAIGGSGDTMPE